MKTEANIKTEICQYLNSIGAYYFRPMTMGYGRSGIPDIVGCLPGGLFIGIEVKNAKGLPSPWQAGELRQIDARKGVGILARSVEDVERIVAPLLRLPAANTP